MILELSGLWYRGGRGWSGMSIWVLVDSRKHPKRDITKESLGCKKRMYSKIAAATDRISCKALPQFQGEQGPSKMTTVYITLSEWWMWTRIALIRKVRKNDSICTGRMAIMTHRTQLTVLLMAMIYYSKGLSSTINEGKKFMGKFRETKYKLPGILSQWSHLGCT